MATNSITITIRQIQHEVPCVQRGRPGYRWAVRYLVCHGGGIAEYPPVTRNEAINRAHELGGRNVKINWE